MHTKSHRFFLSSLFIVLALGSFAACTHNQPKAPLQPTAEPDVCKLNLSEKGIGCVETLIPLENAFDVKLKGNTYFFHISNAGAMKESQMELLHEAAEKQFPIRLQLRKKEILRIEKVIMGVRK